MKELIDKLKKEHILTREEFYELLCGYNSLTAAYVVEEARKVQLKEYGNKIFIRGLIEFTNHCKNNCFYCGIRRDNRNIERYRLTKDEILDCCDQGYRLGFRTFVLQGGEDGYFTDEIMADIIRSIKKAYHGCAITLSIGERSESSYKTLYEAGADRYLLRHETADESHYQQLHPEGLSLRNRKECLYNLKKIGYQVGSGFMVGSPNQTIENIVEDLLFLAELKPHMVGIGPYVPQKDTPFRDRPTGSASLTIYLISILRLMFPGLLIPATTALSTIDPWGREKAVLAGANVVMPNLSPNDAREKYLLYNDKVITGAESADLLNDLKKRFEKIDYEIVVDRGDSHIGK